MLFGSASQRLYYVALYLTAFVIPFPFIFAPIAIMLLFVAWIVNFNRPITISALKERKVIWVWIIFYLLHVAGYFYTYDKATSLQDLQTKMSFFVLPVLIGCGLPLDTDKIERTFKAYITGLFVMAVYFLVRAVATWVQTRDTRIFFYHNLIHSVGANAVYYSLYSFLGLSILLFFPWKNTFLVRKWVFYLTLNVLLLFFILLSSKSMLLLFCVMVLPLYLRRILKTKRIVGYFYVLLGIFIIGFIFFTKNPINQRFHDVLENTDRTEWLPEYANGQKQHFNNLTLRLFLWKTAIQNINGNNLWLAGCGNGGVEFLQKKKISEYGTKNELLNVDPPLWKYNIHNMYLQELMMQGLPGLLLFLMILIVAFFNMRGIHDKIVFLFFNISIVFFMLQESALQTQAGVVFYVFFYMVQCNFLYSQNRQPMNFSMISNNA